MTTELIQILYQALELKWLYLSFVRRRWKKKLASGKKLFNPSDWFIVRVLIPRSAGLSCLPVFHCCQRSFCFFPPDFPLFYGLSFSFWSVRFCGLVSYYFSFSLFSGRFTLSLSSTFPLVCVAFPFCTSLSPVLWALSPGDSFLTKDLFSSFLRSLTLRMAEKWSTLHGWNQKECVDRYLENARRWPFFGCKLFQAQVWEKKPPSYGCKVKAGFHLIAAIKQIPYFL